MNDQQTRDEKRQAEIAAFEDFCHKQHQRLRQKFNGTVRRIQLDREARAVAAVEFENRK
jgi:hypothetical protein